MVVLAVTGSIGVGKSTVMRLLEEESWQVIITDQVVEAERQPNGQLYQPIIDAFGSIILDDSGKIVPRLLGEAVFGDAQKLTLLESIVHPFVRANIVAQLKSNEANANIAIELPLLSESDPYVQLVDHIVVVTASRDLAKLRVRERSGMSASEYSAIRSNQPSDADYANIADTVLVNDGNIADLKRSVEQLSSKLITC